MPKVHKPARSRRPARRAFAGEATIRIGSPPAAANPLRIPALAGLPRKVSIEGEFPHNGHIASPADWLKELLRFRRVGALQDSDRAESSKDFLNLATSRAFPPCPALTHAEMLCFYSFEGAALRMAVDPNLNFDATDYLQPRRFVIVSTRDFKHHTMKIGALVRHFQAKHPGFGSWLCKVMSHDLCLGPSRYLDFISMDCWQGEDSEENAAHEMGEEYDGPTLKDFKALVPEWARAEKFTDDEHERFLHLGRRMLGVDLAPVFEEIRTETVSDWLHDYPPFWFVWDGNDIVGSSIDSIYDMNAQASEQTNVAVALPATNITAAAANLAALWRAATALDQLVGALNRYRKEHKIV